jgi:glycosyltransferase involved in cell wall biosynthesis
MWPETLIKNGMNQGARTSPPAALKIATILSVYGRDDPTATERALQSIADQHFSQAVESRLYVAVDGPIPANLEKVIQRWKPRIHHLQRLPRNVGLAAALNTLIASLESETLVFRMDADDFSRPDRYQKQINYLQAHPEVDILGCDIVEIDAHSTVKRQVAFNGQPGNARMELCKRVPVAHPTVCFRRHVLERIGAYPVNRGNEDIAMWFECAKENFSFGNLHEPLLEFTINRDFWRRRGVKKAFLEFKCYAAGIWSLHGLTWRFVFPLLRLGLRLAPAFVARKAYNSVSRASKSGPVYPPPQQ